MDSLHDVLLHYLTAFSDLVPHHPCVEVAINQIVTNFSDPYYDLNQTMPHTHQVQIHRLLLCRPDYYALLGWFRIGYCCNQD